MWQHRARGKLFVRLCGDVASTRVIERGHCHMNENVTASFDGYILSRFRLLRRNRTARLVRIALALSATLCCSSSGALCERPASCRVHESKSEQTTSAFDLRSVAFKVEK